MNDAKRLPEEFYGISLAAIFIMNIGETLLEKLNKQYEPFL
jgi:hypothetical protein